MSMTRRYSVQARTTTRDERGERLTSYVHQFYLWGESPRDGTVAYRREVGELATEQTVRLRCRFTSGLGPGLKLVAGTDELYVLSAEDVDGTRRFIQIVATRSPATET